MEVIYDGHWSNYAYNVGTMTPQSHMLFISTNYCSMVNLLPGGRSSSKCRGTRIILNEAYSHLDCLNTGYTSFNLQQFFLTSTTAQSIVWKMESIVSSTVRMPPKSILLLFVCCLLAISFVIRRALAWNRLRHIPGPWPAGFTRLWLLRSVLGGDIHLDTVKLCDKYGVYN